MAPKPTPATPPPAYEVLAEGVTVGSKTYPRGAVTTAIPLTSVRWLLASGEIRPAPATKEATDGASR